MTEDQLIQPGSPIAKELLDACIHCGMCLPACPTYLATGREMESPRGRIALLNAWQTGAQEFSPRMAQHIDSCLGCLGCQTACPSGVDYEKILNTSRPELAKKRNAFQRALMRFSFAWLLPNYFLLAIFGFLLRVWQMLRGRAVLSFLAKLLPLPILKGIADAESYLPPVRANLPILKGAILKSSHSENLTVQFFRGCVMDIFYNHVNCAAARLLLNQGRGVQLPNQTCCGALAFHAGETDIALDLAKKNIALFEKTSGDIVVTSAGCGAMLKEYNALFSVDNPWHARATQFGKRIKDISQTLAQGQFQIPATSKNDFTVQRVAYHAACHLAHAQNVRTEPNKLLVDLTKTVGNVRVELVPLQEAELCCGSAGIYNLLHEEMASLVLDRKMANIEQTGADLVVTSNPGCLLQLERGINRKGLPVKVEHLVELLDRFYS
jgi:glycolate oxidase iron-sulfur subunit